MDKHKHAVIIYPHPDDESFGAAGTITKFRKEGVPVTYLCGTLGEMGRNMGPPAFANRETLPEIRKKELITACNSLDINLEMLGYRDKTLEFEDRQAVAKDIKERLEKIKPSLVITHYPGHAVHPDHDAFGAAAIEAVNLLGPNERPEVWAQAISNNHQEELGSPDIVMDVTAFFDDKLQAINAHNSQASGMFSKFKEAGNAEMDVDKELKKRLGKEAFYVWDFGE